MRLNNKVSFFGASRRRKRRSMIKLLRNKGNGRASSSPQKLKLFGDPIIGAMTLQMVEAKGEDLENDLKDYFFPIGLLLFSSGR